jgi:uncharacterized membrane protein YcaP (DUF421 family)
VPEEAVIQDLWATPSGMAVIVVRTLAVYLFILVAFRLSGKREVGQLAPFDFALILLIANAVQNAMVGPDTSLQGGLLAAAVLLLLNLAVSRLRLLNPRVERAVEGSPTPLIRDGFYLEGNLKREGLTHEEVGSALREHGLVDEREVRFAYLEPDGAISIVPMSTPVLRSRKRVRQLKKR